MNDLSHIYSLMFVNEESKEAFVDAVDEERRAHSALYKEFLHDLLLDKDNLIIWENSFKEWAYDKEFAVFIAPFVRGQVHFAGRFNTKWGYKFDGSGDFTVLGWTDILKGIAQDPRRDLDSNTAQTQLVIET